jgi:dihydropteroate synthase
LEQFRRVKELHQAGVNLNKIVEETGLGWRTVAKETVQNLGVITPLNETDAGSNFRLRHAHGGGVPRPVQPAVYGSTCWWWTGRAG